MNRLTTRQVETLKKPGRHTDGGGLYLYISKAGGVSGRRWIFRFTSPVTGKIREMGLGSAAPGSGVPLSEARRRAGEQRQHLRDGQDPIDARPKPARVLTFGDVADRFIESHRSGWRNPKHVAQWTMTLSTYCEKIRDKPVNQVATADVLEVLQPLWRTRPETASRLRGRIERVLDYAAAHDPTVRAEWPGNNPARWRGHLDSLLPRPAKLTRGHHKALPFKDIPSFMEDLRSRQATAGLLLEFTILTAVRSSEARLAQWNEIDLDRAVWTVPRERLKTDRHHRPADDHRVPLSARTLEILGTMRRQEVGDLVFPGAKPGRPLSVMAMTVLLRRMGRGDITVHGFRSTFRDWAAETTSFPREVCEMALGHEITNKVEAAYRRGDLFEKRRQLMKDWSDFCGLSV